MAVTTDFTGLKGDTGDAGPLRTVGTVMTTTGAAGTSAAATIVDGGSGVTNYTYTIPRGDTGATGPTGQAVAGLFGTTGAGIGNDVFTITFNVDAPVGAGAVTDQLTFTGFSAGQLGTTTSYSDDTSLRIIFENGAGAGVQPNGGTNNEILDYFFGPNGTSKEDWLTGIALQINNDSANAPFAATSTATTLVLTVGAGLSFPTSVTRSGSTGTNSGYVSHAIVVADPFIPTAGQVFTTGAFSYLTTLAFVYLGSGYTTTAIASDLPTSTTGNGADWHQITN